MTNRELGASIRAELKASGYRAKEFSVRVRDCGYSNRVDVTIKSPFVSRKAVDTLLQHHSAYERDARTGEILEGGNTYVFVQYDDGIFDELAKEWGATAAAAIASEEETTRIFDGLYLLNIDHEGKLQIRQQNENDFCTFHVSGIQQLSEFLYKFNAFGTIAA